MPDFQAFNNSLKKSNSAQSLRSIDLLTFTYCLIRVRENTTILSNPSYHHWSVKDWAGSNFARQLTSQTAILDPCCRQVHFPNEECDWPTAKKHNQWKQMLQSLHKTIPLEKKDHLSSTITLSAKGQVVASDKKAAIYRTHVFNIFSFSNFPLHISRKRTQCFT